MLPAMDLRTLLTFATLLVLANGCTLYRTRSVVVHSPGQVSVRPEQIELVKHDQALDRPYQLLGKVAVFQSRSAVLKNPANTEWPGADKRLRKAAAAMGADALVGIHDGTDGVPGGRAFRSGVAVRWLPPGGQAVPVAREFIVGLLPMTSVGGAPTNIAILPAKVAAYAQYKLEQKGYCVLPVSRKTAPFTLDEVLQFSESRRQGIGGDLTQLLLEFRFVDYYHEHNALINESAVRLLARLWSKKSGRVVWTGDRQGGLAWSIFHPLGLLGMVVDSETGLSTSAQDAIGAALRTIPYVSND